MTNGSDPAFPIVGTLRDWFAGQALASGHVWGLGPSAVEPITPEQVAAAHVRMADAMVAELAKP